MKSLLVFFAIGFSTLIASAAPAPAVGDQAPCLTFDQVAADGAVAAGSTCAPRDNSKKIVLDFFDTGCIYCVQYMPTYESLATKYNSKAEFVVVGLDSDTKVLVDWFKRRSSWKNYEVMMDPMAKTVDAFQIEGTPTTIVIGADGKILHIHVGTVETAAELKALEDAIAQ